MQEPVKDFETNGSFRYGWKRWSVYCYKIGFLERIFWSYQTRKFMRFFVFKSMKFLLKDLTKDRLNGTSNQ